jgi:predicted secreted hydrolase
MKGRPRLLLAAGLLVLMLLPLAVFLKPHREKPPERLTVADALGGAADPGFLRADRPRRFRFPADHGPHPGYRTEWWYFTGNLHASTGRRFGYQLTFFRFALTPHPRPGRSAWGTNEVFMAHFTLTDEAGKRFRVAERLSRAALGLAGAGGSPPAVRLEEWSAVALPGEELRMELRARSGSDGLNLRVRQLGPAMLNGERGLSRKGNRRGNASYYYSIPRLATAGTLRIDGSDYQVTGLSWLDREWGTTELEPHQAGWDWFGLQLADGRSLMFYRLRQKNGATDPASAGTLLERDGTAIPLGAGEVRLEVVSRWRSPVSGIEYPSQWRIVVPGKVDLEVVPLIPGQELSTTSVRYWEGAVALRDAAGGQAGAGYVELTGYGEGAAAGRAAP